MKFFSLSVLLFLVCLIAAGEALAEGELVRALKSREVFFQTVEKQTRQDWQKLIREFESAALAQEEPRHASRARFMAARLSFDSAVKFKNKDDFQRAETFARRAVRDCPRCTHAAEAQLIHGRAIMELGDRKEEAERQLMKVELNYPQSPQVAEALSLLAQLRGTAPPRPQAPAKPDPPKNQAAPGESKDGKKSAEGQAAKQAAAKGGQKTPAKPKKTTIPPAPKARDDGRAQVYFLTLEDHGRHTTVTAYVDRVSPYVYNLIPPTRPGGSFRAYADIKNAVIAPKAVRELKETNSLVKLAKMNQFQNDVVRLVIDLTEAHPYMPVFVDKPPRLVFNIAKESKNLPSTPPEAQPEPPEPKAKPSNKDIQATKGPSDSLVRQLGLKVNSIVLDPGHGGKDNGASGFGLKEKDIVLKLAQKLKTRLEKRLGIAVHLTRTDDTFITLERRTKIAKSKKADIFISLHVNANKSPAVEGFETYILNFTTDKSAMAVAARENAASDKTVSELDDVLQSIAKNTKIAESRSLAQALHKSALKALQKKYKVRDIGVKEAPFFVLVGAEVPAALVEIGFITNETEAARLKTEAYLDQVAEGLAEGLASYVLGL